jgi:hypothetical protein
VDGSIALRKKCFLLAEYPKDKKQCDKLLFADFEDLLIESFAEFPSPQHSGEAQKLRKNLTMDLSRNPLYQIKMSQHHSSLWSKYICPEFGIDNSSGNFLKYCEVRSDMSEEVGHKIQCLFSQRMAESVGLPDDWEE